MQQRILVILACVLAIILSLGIGIFAGTKITKKTAVPQGAATNADNTYQAGWDAAMQTLKDSGALPQMLEATEVKNIDGKIESISGNDVTIKVSTPGLISTPTLLTRTVTIDPNTKIIQLVQRDQAEIQKEFEIFNEKMQQQQTQSVTDPKDMPYPPQMQDKKDVSLGDLKVGQTIMVQAAEDIKDKKQFAATEIQIQQSIATPENLPQLPTPPVVAPATPISSPAIKAPTAPAPAPKNLPTAPTAPVAPATTAGNLPSAPVVK